MMLVDTTHSLGLLLGTLLDLEAWGDKASVFLSRLKEFLARKQSARFFPLTTKILGSARSGKTN